MGHNSVVSKSIGIPRIDGLSTGPPDLGCHNIFFQPPRFDLWLIAWILDFGRVCFRFGLTLFRLDLRANVLQLFMNIVKCKRCWRYI